MDIVDVLVARSLTPQGQIDTYAAKAQKAVTDATKIVNDIEAITEQTNTNNENAQTALENAQAAAEEYESIVDDIDAKIAAIDAVQDTTAEDTETASYKGKNIKVRKNGLWNAINIVKNYLTTGSNEDGSMTQKAITEKLNLGSANKGKIAVIGEDGFLVSGSIKESEINSGGGSGEGGEDTPVPANKTLGITIDYENKIIIREEDAIGLTPGADFNQFSMYGGRMRCNVNSNGQIIAWYGDLNYADDGTNGDVMIYQPKFYYKRIINKVVDNTVGKIIRQETLLIRETPKSGFKLHPRFKTNNGEELEYILIPAYEGSLYDVSTSSFNRNNNNNNIDYNNDYLVSCATSLPTTRITVVGAEQLANNKGNNWHITDMGVESINQMLFMIEYASLEGQSSIGMGIATRTNSSLATGLTAELGNNTGEAPLDSPSGHRAMSYRGYENWWGNVWNFIGGFSISGNTSSQIGIPYIATDFNYDPVTLTNYSNIGFSIPNQNGWISGMGYGNEQYDWIYFPAECLLGNSVLPVGDSFWTMVDFSKSSAVGAGGMYSSSNNCGAFYYSCDRQYNYYSATYGARIMFIPDKNTVYNSNYQNWLAKRGG